MKSFLFGKKIVVGISGAIAAFKTISVVRELVKRGASVKTILTQSATKFVTPLTFETIANNECITSAFERNGNFDVGHISLSKWADAFLIIPATANIIAKIASGIADDMLTSAFLASKCPKIVFPSMNTGMFENEATQSNIQTIISRKIHVVEPAKGRLACGDVGKGRLPDIDIILKSIENILASRLDFKGKRLLITAGPTQEAIDPVRFLTNRSSGRMGYAIAEAASNRGANVTLVSGRTEIEVPSGVNAIFVESAKQMHEAVLDSAQVNDIYILSAAVADYTPKVKYSNKIKKNQSNIVLELGKTKDILEDLGKINNNSRIICGFSMETENLLENSKKKLIAKNVDMIIANNINDFGAGFDIKTNKVHIITRNDVFDIPLMLKTELADVILDHILKLRKFQLER